MPRDLITVVIPVLNESAVLDALAKRLVPVLDSLGLDWRILFVDDGSSDDTLDVIARLNANDARLTAIGLSRNFGKEIAIAAGLRNASGDAVVLMDADLQHPPETITAFIQEWREGYEVVYAKRLDRRTDGPLRRLFSRVYYRLFNVLVKTDIPEGAGDFRLLDRKAVDAMNRLGERSRFNKGLFSWIGYRTTSVPYRVEVRAGGVTRWSLRRLTSFALDGITSFSTWPLRMSSLFGLAISLTAFATAIIYVIKTLIFGADLPGFPTLIVSMMLFSGVQLIFLGVIGEYLGRIYEEVKARPLYLVAREIGRGGDMHEVRASSRNDRRAHVSKDRV